MPTLPPPVLAGSGSTVRGLFRSQPAITDAAPRGWGRYRGRGLRCPLAMAAMRWQRAARARFMPMVATGLALLLAAASPADTVDDLAWIAGDWASQADGHWPSEERTGRTECVSTCRTRVSQTLPKQ